MFTPRFKLQLVLAWIAAFAIGAAVGLWWRGHVRAMWLDHLQADASRCALALDPEKIAKLTGTKEDLGRPEYLSLKDRLGKLRAVHPEVRFVSLFRCVPGERRVIYLADSEPAGSRELSPPGAAFPEASAMPGLQSILRDGKPATEGPIQDTFGIFVTGYAQVGEPRETAAGTVRELIALDIEAHTWNRELWDAGAHAALYVWILLGAPLVLLTVKSGRVSRDALIHKLSQAIQQSQSGILITSLDGRIEFVNEGLCRQLGYTAKELVGHPCREFMTSSVPRDLIAEMIVDVRAGRSWEGEWFNSRKTGETYAVRGVVSPVLGGGRERLGYIAVLTDTTSQQRYQDELRAAKDLAEAADRAKGQFLATMSHEVRTPVHGIVGFTNLLLETPLSPEQREYVQTIRTSGEALVQLTGDILDFSRIESGGVQLEPSSCDLRVTIEDALDIFAARAAERGIELLHWVDPDVPPQVVVDAGRLRQVLVNLIGNGIKFTPAGEVEVSVRMLTGKSTSIAPFDLSHTAGQMVAEFDDGSLTFEFAVRDTGVGISSADRPKLFQPFTQLDASTVRRYGGAGLGLAISRNLVRLMSGDIWLESDPGKGSTFYFTVRGRPLPKSESQAPIPVSLAGCRVAVITSTPRLRGELERLLAYADAKAVPLEWPHLSAAPWDLAILDCAESILGELHLHARQDSWRAERIVGLVNVTVNSVERQAIRPHVRILMNKPVHHRTLIDLLARAAAKSVAKEGGTATSH